MIKSHSVIYAQPDFVYVGRPNYTTTIRCTQGLRSFLIVLFSYAEMK